MIQWDDNGNLQLRVCGSWYSNITHRPQFGGKMGKLEVIFYNIIEKSQEFGTSKSSADQFRDSV